MKDTCRGLDTLRNNLTLIHRGRVIVTGGAYVVIVRAMLIEQFPYITGELLEEIYELIFRSNLNLHEVDGMIVSYDEAYALRDALHKADEMLRDIHNKNR